MAAYIPKGGGIEGTYARTDWSIGKPPAKVAVKGTVVPKSEEIFQGNRFSRPNPGAKGCSVALVIGIAANGLAVLVDSSKSGLIEGNIGAGIRESAPAAKVE